MLNGAALDLLVEALVASGGYRVQRRLDLNARPRPANDDGAGSVGVVIDVETTGVDARSCRVIELALRRFRYDAAGAVTRLDRVYSWREDPGEPLSPEVAQLTGLRDGDLAGQSIDETLASTLIASAALRIAFNATFDRRVVERRLPGIAGLPWACAMRKVDWRDRGFDGSGRSLSWLLSQAGWFHGAHRAGADVDATIALLEHRALNGRTALSELLATAGRPTWRFEAVGADFSVKNVLRGRGYRWDCDGKVWWREVGAADCEAETGWLTAEVYAPWHRPRADGPVVREVTWCTRHG